jgi:hypothetical protein
MPLFETIPAKRSHCSKIACLTRDDQREAIIALGLDPYRELVQAFDQTPAPTAWLIDGELAALGGVAGPPGTCPIGVAWLVIAEYATRFSFALVREVKRQLTSAHEIYPLVVSPLLPTDKKSLRFAAFLGFAVEHAHLQDGLLFVVFGGRRSSIPSTEFWRRQNL